MIQLILMLSLTSAQPAPKQTAQFQPCVWPNKCAEIVVPVAQVGPCTPPRVCGTTQKPS